MLATQRSWNVHWPIWFPRRAYATFWFTMQQFCVPKILWNWKLTTYPLSWKSMFLALIVL